MATGTLTLRSPVGGLNRRLGYQWQPPFTTYDCLNFFPDGALTERERGGMRRGAAKFSATEMGSGGVIRMTGSVRFISSGATVTRLVASAGGLLYTVAPDGTAAAVTSALTLASDRALSCVDFQQKLYIADYGPTLASASDGVIGGAGFDELTSATVGDFASDGVNDDDHAVWIRSHNAINCVQTVTIDATGGVFLLRDDLNDLTTEDIAEDAAASVVEDALETIYGAGNVTVSGSAGGPYTVTFGGDLAGTPVALMTADSDYLTGGAGTATVAMTTAGATTTTHAGVYNIESVATTTLTLVKALVSLTGVDFIIARCPKVYDPVANTLSKWLQDDYTTADAPTDDDVGLAKGAIPLGRSIVCSFHGRVYLAGGIYSPATFDACRIGDAHDWDFAQDDVGRAVDGSVDDAGRIAEPITALIPHQQSCMLIGGKGSVWVLRGDITSGEIVNLDQQVGILDKQAWCVTAQGVLVFLSTNGLYAMPTPCGGKAVSISKELLPQEFRNIDPSTTTVSLEYCHDQRAVIVFPAVNSTATAATWWLIDVAVTAKGDGFSNAFFPQALASHNFEPFSLHAWRDLVSGQSVVMFGCRDGYIRQLRRDLAQDDGSNFNSYALIGPVHGGRHVAEQGKLQELRAVIPASSGDVDVAVYAGKSAELALAATPTTFEFNTVGHSASRYPSLSGSAFWFKVSNGETNVRWELECLVATLLPAGGVK